MRNTFIFSVFFLLIASFVSCSKEIPVTPKPFIIKEWKIESISLPRLISAEVDTIVFKQPAGAVLEFTEFGTWFQKNVIFPEPLPAPLPNITAPGNRIITSASPDDFIVVSGNYKIGGSNKEIYRFLASGSDTLKILKTTDTTIQFSQVVDLKTYLINCKK